jgi:ABC-type multidrug transport system fused ATPase/permease subunit
LQSIVEHCTGSTLIIITHRVASITWMSRIVVLDRGEIAASGDHTSLHKTSPLYQRLYESNPITVQ